MAAMAGGRSPGGDTPELPLWLEREWQAAYGRVKGYQPARRLWDLVLSADDRARLGGDPEAAYRRFGGAAGMWKQLRGVSVPRAVVDVGLALTVLDPGVGAALLREFGEAPDDPAAAVEHAVARGGLVVVESPRGAYWEGKPIPIDWERHGRPWALLFELARQAKAGAAVDAEVFHSGATADRRYVSKLKNRLVNTPDFPPDLGMAVVRVGPGTYRLDLPPEQVRVFVRGAVDAPSELRS